MGKPILDLSTLDPVRPVIAIDGQKYECAVPDDFGAAQYARFERLFARVQQIRHSSENESEEEAIARAEEAEDACRKAVAIILPKLPSKVQAKLRLNQLFAILKAYTDFFQAAGATSPASPLPNLIGASSSRDSSDSMAETPQTG